jgi:hypothetical protein
MCDTSVVQRRLPVGVAGRLFLVDTGAKKEESMLELWTMDLFQLIRHCEVQVKHLVRMNVVYGLM